jgi:hypothetical protein
VKRFNPKKIDLLLIAVAYVGLVIYLVSFEYTGFLFALLLAIPGTPVVLIFGSIFTGAVMGLVKPLIRWLRR